MNLKLHCKHFAVISLFFALLFANFSYAQSVGIGTPNPDSSAMLEISAANKGLLIPRVSLDINNISVVPNPQTGLLVYNTNTAYPGGQGFYYNTGTKAVPSWEKIFTSQDGWSINGNSSILGTNFLGTTNDIDLRLVRNSEEALRIAPGGALMATGTASGVAPVNVPGFRMMWIPSLFAFRAGKVDGVQWNNSNIGSGSFAAGVNTTASGSASTALGSGTSAIGANAFAVGFNSTAFGNNAIAMGNNNLANAVSSVAIGDNANATAANAVAIGTAVASNVGVVAIGYATTASGISSYAFGNTCNATASNTVAIGTLADATAASGIAIGNNANATTGANTIAIGTLADAVGTSSIAIGNDANTTNVANAIAIGNLADATGIASLALGNNANATQSNVVSIGYAANGSGVNAIAMGFTAAANKSNTIAIGGFATADSTNAIAIGNNANASGEYAAALGLTTANGFYSFSAGLGTIANAVGSVALGRYNVDAAASPSNPISTDRVLQFGNGSSNAVRADILYLTRAGNLVITGSLTAAGINYPSDIRLKTDIQPLKNVLKNIEHIQPITYYFKDKQRHPATHQIGFSAQEIEKEFPELIQKTDEGYLSVNYPQMVSVAIQAIKEQQEQIRKLQEALQSEKMKNAQQQKVNEMLIFKINDIENQLFKLSKSFK